MELFVWGSRYGKSYSS